MILNLLQIFQSIKLKELSALISLAMQTDVPDEDTEQVNTSSRLGQMDIGKLLKLSQSEINSDCPLKTLKVIESAVFQDFLSGLIQEYVSLFGEQCLPQKMDLRMIQVAAQVGRPTKDLDGVFLGFFHSMISEINEVVRHVLCSPEARVHGFNQIQAGLHIMLQQYQALNRIGPSFAEVFRQQVFKKVLAFHFSEATTAILAELNAFNFDQYISLSSSKQILEDLTTNICQNFERVKVELALFKQLQTDVDVLYEKSFLETFEGVLVYFQTRMCTVRTAGVGDLTKPPSEKVTPFTVNLMSRVTREISFTSIFGSLCAALNLNHSVQSDLWQHFLAEKVSLVKDKYDLFSIHLRKQFIDAYDFAVNQQVGAYIADLKHKQKQRYASSSDEPAKISEAILGISETIHRQLFRDLGLSRFAKILNKIGQNLGPFLELVESIEKPDMISPSLKTTHMEMEIDKFLAKKSGIYNKVLFQNQFVDAATSPRGSKHDRPDLTLEFHIVKAVLHLMLKSFYERIRSLRVTSAKTYNQVMLDIYYLYCSCVFMTHFLFSGISSVAEFDPEQVVFKEEHQNLCGLINEIMCSTKARIVDEEIAAKVGQLDEQLMLTICEVNLQSLFNSKF